MRVREFGAGAVHKYSAAGRATKNTHKHMLLTHVCDLCVEIKNSNSKSPECSIIYVLLTVDNLSSLQGNEAG